MSDPIKIIYKVKNNNAKHQYYIYIYIGLVPDNIMKILEKIRELSLYNSFLIMTLNDMRELDKFYGTRWYTLFFNKYHIRQTMDIIVKTKKHQSELKNKYGELWFTEHIEQASEHPQQRTYGYLVKRALVHHELRTHHSTEYIPEEINDYTIESQQNTLLSTYQTGGDADEQDPVEEEYSEEIEEIEEPQDQYEQELADLEKIYNAEETVNKKETEKTVSLIQKVLANDNIIKKKESKMIKFDVSKDTNIYSETLADVFTKIYVKEQYIFKDDTIKVIKNKIFCSIKNHPRYGKKCYLLPSRQYIWSEYLHDKKVDRVMIGHKWIQKQELMKVDSEPISNIKVYTELRGTMKTLRNDMKRFNSKIRYEDDNNNILFDYDSYFDNNELFLIDIYNEIGLNTFPSVEELSNITDTFFKIYFPKISQSDIHHIIDYLNGNVSVEKDKIERNFESVNTDLLLENEVVNIVEKVKREADYTHIMKENFITQSMINLLLSSYDIENFHRIDMFQIFDDFIPTDTHPFIQYMTPDGNVLFKFNESEMSQYIKDPAIADVVAMWFQNVTTGISFKIKTDKINPDSIRFMTVNINELGKLDYKIQWKMEDRAIIEDIAKTYDIIRSLIEEINKTSIKHKFAIPTNTDFKTAFITTIQHFVLDNERVIDHNDLSQFARYFFPYFALVIEPKKRISKIHAIETSSKYGTYLRYKRITKYEDIIKIEQRILYFMRNYDCTEQQVIDEISKQFNITHEKSAEHLKNTIQRYPKIKKTRKELKKFTSEIKYKSPGIDVAIQGKTPDRYNIRISGARDKQQLMRIINALNIMIYLYADIYIFKKPTWQYLKDRLKKLNNIAERRHIVSDFVKYSSEKMNIKAMAEADKKRIGYKPEKGQSHYTRVCQNSGTQQRRRPQQFTTSNIDDMIKQGYLFNKATGMYEKRVMKKENGKTISKVLRAVKLNSIDESGNPEGNEVFYTCSPEQNGIHTYIGFLSKSKNPNGEYMPCCFKKDQYLSDNEEKRNLFLRGIGQQEEQQDQVKVTTTDQLYILQDTNKIQPDRFGMLPKILIVYFNNALNLKCNIIQHNLIHSPDGYFFKFGIQHEPNSFLSAIATTLGLGVQELMDKAVDSITNDKEDVLFTSLNNGDIKTNFGQRDNYLKYLKNQKDIAYDIVSHLLCTPTVIKDNGMNIIIFARSVQNNSDGTSQDDCIIVCHNNEEVDNILIPERDTILLYYENENYFPIFNVIKKSKIDRDIIIQKTFSYENKKSNIISHIKDFYQNNCTEKTIHAIVNKESILTAKALYIALKNHKNSDYTPIAQYVDSRNKCHYLITKKNSLIPVSISGSIYNLPIITNISKYIETYAKTNERLLKIYDDFDTKLPIRPISVNYDTRTEKSINIRNIIVQTRMLIPVLPENISVKQITTNNLTIEISPAYNAIDTLLVNNQLIKNIDERIKQVSYEKYISETYNLFKYIFSDYITQPNLSSTRNKLIKIIQSRKDKINEIKTIIYRLIDSDLLNLHLKVISQTEDTKVNDEMTSEELTDESIEESIEEPTEQSNNSISSENTELSTDNILSDLSDETTEEIFQSGGRNNKFIHIVDKQPDIQEYKINNIRSTCDIHPKQTCSVNPQCLWEHGNCVFSLTKQLIIMYVNRISAELIENGLGAFEILHIEDYTVSRVVNKSYFSERPNQKIIKSSSDNVVTAINTFFGKTDTIKLGKNRKVIANKEEIDKLNQSNPLRDFGNKYIQIIIENNNTLLRAYANGYYWLENQYIDINSRNIGYYSKTQTDIMVYLKSLIIDWLLDRQNYEIANKLLKKHTKETDINSYIIKLASNVSYATNGNLELSVLNLIRKIPIVIYEGDAIIKVFDNELIVDKFDKYEKQKKMINIQFEDLDDKQIPSIIGVIYYK